MQNFLSFAEEAFSSRQFEAIVARSNVIPDNEAEVPLAQAWLGRAHFELGAPAEGRRLLAQAVSASGELPAWATVVLQHATWADETPFDERIPDLLRQNVEQFGRFVEALIQSGDTSRPLPDARFTSATLAMYWVRTGIRTLTLEKDNRHIMPELTELGFAAAFLDAAWKGPERVAQVCAALSTDVSFATDTSMSPRLFDVASTILLRAKPMLCPFTGTRGLTRDSIDLYVYRYVHDGRVCLALADNTAARAASDSAWFLPERRVLLAARSWVGLHRTLARALDRAFSNHQEVVRYLTDEDERPVMVTDIYVGHLGHYIWNSISGWSGLFDRVPSEKIDLIATHRNSQIFGGVKELYPDHHARVGELIEIDGEYEAYRIMLDRGALALTLGDRHITQDLAERVINWCRGRCSAEFLSLVADARSACKPLLLVTIRLENRAWVEQECGLPHILNRLVTDFPGLGVVLDGLNSDIAFLDTHAFMSLDEEQRVARHIIESCPDVLIHNSIGCLPTESIVWCDAVDAFLAPIGAGMAKYRWITNKPGVAYSNETCLATNSYDGRLYERHRDDVVPMEYVAREAVTDVEGERHGLRFRANFSMEWEAAYFKISGFLTQLFPAERNRVDAPAIFEVEQSSGFWNVCVDAKRPIAVRLGGQPHAPMQSGWRARFLYAGFAPVLLLELEHENGTMATWFLDESMNRVGGRVDELSDESRLWLRQRLQTGRYQTDGFSQVNQYTSMTIRGLLDQ